jgi:hypothetical protein
LYDLKRFTISPLANQLPKGIKVLLTKTIKKYSDEKNILVYQMGKVGSSSLERSLPGSIHKHSFFGNPPNPTDYYLRNNTQLKLITSRLKDIFKVFLIKRRKTVKIICPIRPALSRNISMYFQALPFWLADYQTGYYSKSFERDGRKDGLEILFDSFNKNFPHSYPDDWFSTELMKLSGIDVLTDVEKNGFNNGYHIYKNGKYEVLVIRADLLSKKVNVLNNFTGENIQIENTNVSSNKWYSAPYSLFKQNYEMESTISSLYSELRINKLFE